MIKNCLMGTVLPPPLPSPRGRGNKMPPSPCRGWVWGLFFTPPSIPPSPCRGRGWGLFFTPSPGLFNASCRGVWPYALTCFDMKKLLWLRPDRFLKPVRSDNYLRRIPISIYFPIILLSSQLAPTKNCGGEGTHNTTVIDPRTATQNKTFHIC